MQKKGVWLIHWQMWVAVIRATTNLRPPLPLLEPEKSGYPSATVGQGTEGYFSQRGREEQQFPARQQACLL